MKAITLFIICALMLGCAPTKKSVKTTDTENLTSTEVAIKNILVWQNISEISNSNFYKIVKQKLYQKNGVSLTNILLTVPAQDGTEGTITIPLNKKYNNFSTKVCVVVGNPWPYETITVYCDDQEKQIIKKIGPKNAPRNLDINTKDVDVLTIKVKPGRKGYYEKVIFFDSILN